MTLRKMSIKSHASRYGLLLLLLFNSLIIFSQNIEVTGRVTGGLTDEPLPGVNIMIKGTTTGVVSNTDGDYVINVPDNEAILIFSFLGFLTEEIQVNGRTNINLVMAEDIQALDEVVVVGYGVQRKSDLTGSVASVSTEELQRVPVLNVGESLKGRVAGMQVSTSDPAPGGGINIRIRGINTISGSSGPLIVVDGYTSAGDLNAINPRDIKSIEVLKDASATAIYGARGANGVILITTFQGEKGTPQIDLSTSYTSRSLSNKIEMMNAQQFLEFQNEALSGAGGEIPDFSEYETTDWQDEVYRQGAQRNYQLTIKGGNEKTNYFISGGYMKDDGIVMNSYFERYSMRMKTDTELKKWLSVNNTVYFARTMSNGTPRNTIGYGFNPSLSDAALTFYPHYPIKDAVGNYTNMSFKTNPVAIAEGRVNELLKNFIYDYAELIATPLEGLTLKTTFGATISNNLNQGYWPSWVENVAGALGGIADQSTSQSLSWSNENIISYVKSIGLHNFNITGAFTQESSSSNYLSAGSNDFLNDALSYYNLSGGNPETFSIGAGASQNTLMSYLGRVFYNYNQRYYITASVRRDGSSKFAEGKKFGSFPSVALAWRISEEDFMQNISVVSNLKLRASWGKTGNYTALGDYESKVRFRVASSPAAIFNNLPQVTLRQNAMGNPNLGWETSTQSNIGIDIGFLDGKYSIVADAYSKLTTDLLLSVNLPAGFPVSSRRENVGSVENKGLEIAFNGQIIDTRAFKWNSTLNFSINRNNVVELAEQDYYTVGPYSGVMSDAPGVVMVGKPLGSFYGYVYDGIFADNSVPYYDKTQYSYLGSNPYEGYIRIKDVNMDGKIDGFDRVVIGNAEPDFILGFVNNFSYKNFDLSVYIDGVQGADMFNATRLVIENTNAANNVSTRVLDRWTPDNRNASIPGAGKFLNTTTSYYVEDASYIKFRDIQLAYNLKSARLQQIGIEDIRIYASLQNYFTITNYTGYDPEVNMSGGSATVQNLDLGIYPSAKSMTFGLNLSY
jgi:TonB-dependent starch-binding outer membrane protein SusC